MLLVIQFFSLFLSVLKQNICGVLILCLFIQHCDVSCFLGRKIYIVSKLRLYFYIPCCLNLNCETYIFTIFCFSVWCKKNVFYSFTSYWLQLSCTKSWISLHKALDYIVVNPIYMYIFAPSPWFVRP